MVPIQFQRVLEAQTERPRDLSSMHAMMSCGSPLHEDSSAASSSAFPCGIIELYGLTEGIITTLDPEDAEGRWSSVGKPLIGTDILLIGDDDRPCRGGQVRRDRLPRAHHHARLLAARGCQPRGALRR
jgi:acyl-coenzyme A synthetase/AMP-(fatty) acid ligase